MKTVYLDFNISDELACLIRSKCSVQSVCASNHPNTYQPWPNSILTLFVDVLDMVDVAWKPFLSISVDPNSDATLASSVGETTLPVLFTVSPVAFVSLTVWPHVDAESMLLVFIVLSVVLSPIRPWVHSSYMQLILFPTSFISPSIWPFIDSLPVNEVTFPVSIVLSTIDPLINSFAMLHPIVELTFIYASILQYLGTLTFL